VTVPKLLVFGRNGQVAQELARARADIRCLGRAEVDLSEPEACAEAVLAHRPRAVINAAAWTAVDRAESEEASARVVNAEAPAAMARACASLNIPLVHLSTDYVFDGSGEAPFAPHDATGPLSAYGRTKRAGEDGVRAAGCVHAIVRTSWVFSGHGSNFVKTMVRLGAARERLSVVSDQIGGPTPARAIAAACLVIADHLQAQPTAAGTYHFAGSPEVSWADFAREIMRNANLPCQVDDIPTSQYPTPARRPLNSRLDCESLETTFGLTRPDWRRGLEEVLREIGAEP
jgi:dTDP-4-dehydrorhamnose reductase